MKIIYAVIVFAFCSQNFALAQGFTEEEKNAVETCVSEPEFHISACSPKHYTQCYEIEVKRAPNPSQARVWCELRMISIWEEITDEWVAAIKGELPKRELHEFESVLAHWKEDKSCSFRNRNHNESFWFFKNPSECDYKRTQITAEYLYDILNMIKDEKFKFQLEP